MIRRQLLKVLSALPVLGTAARAAAAPPADMKAVQALQAGWKALLAPKADIAPDAQPIKLSAAEWKKRLGPAAYDVLREEGTEPPDRARSTTKSATASSSVPDARYRSTARR